MRARLRRDFFRARTIQNSSAHLLVHRRDRLLAKVAERIADHLVGDLLIALTHDDVDRGLTPDKLRERRYHDRIAEFDAYAARLFQGVGKLSFLADLP